MFRGQYSANVTDFVQLTEYDCCMCVCVYIHDYTMKYSLSNCVMTSVSKCISIHILYHMCAFALSTHISFLLWLKGLRTTGIHSAGEITLQKEGEVYLGLSPGPTGACYGDNATMHVI